MNQKIIKTEDEWRAILTPQEFLVLRERGTESAFSGAYWHTKTPGIYRCAACGLDIYDSKTKFDSGTGWPSFWQPLALDRVELVQDTSGGLNRTEVLCGRCGSHLGHVFPDGPPPTGQRHCINSIALKLRPTPARSKLIRW